MSPTLRYSNANRSFSGALKISGFCILIVSFILFGVLYASFVKESVEQFVTSFKYHMAAADDYVLSLRGN